MCFLMKNNFARVMFTHYSEMLSYITDLLLETKQMYVNGKVSMHRSWKNSSRRDEKDRRMEEKTEKMFFPIPM